VAQARNLYVQSVLAAEKQQFLAAASASAILHTARSERALQAGDLAPEQVTGDVAVLFDVRTRLGTAERSGLLANQSLRSLLGLGPEVPMPLQPLDAPEMPEQAAVAIALSQLAQSRPDLRALRAGYESQEERLLGSVLAQFPNISINFNKARDTGDIHTTGFGVTLDLPLFDRGQSAIAIERATREQLRAEYEARLDQATGDAWRLWNEMQEVGTEIHDLNTYLPQLQTTTADAERSYASGDLPVPTYLTMLNALLNGKSDLLDLQQSLWTDAIALSTVLGTQIQPATGTKDSNR
jgi:outer membrane protein TolC